jgi:phage tail sheath gpL-like
MVSFDRVSATAKAAQVYVEEQAKLGSLASLLIPQKLLFFGQYNAGKTPTNNVAVKVLGESDLIAAAGRGSMAHLIAKKIFPTFLDVYWVPVADGTTKAVATALVNGACTTAGVISLYVAGQRLQIPVALNDAAIAIATAIAAAATAALDLPVTVASGGTATATFTSRGGGVWGNDMTLKMDIQAGDLAAEPVITGGITLSAFTTGATNPDLTAALAALGDTFYTKIIVPYDDATNTTAVAAAGTARDDPGVKRPFKAVFGSIKTAANFISALASYNSTWMDFYPVESSPSIPFEIAAAAAVAIAERDAASPGRTGAGLVLDGIRPGAVPNWLGSTRESVVAAGGSTTTWDASGIVRIKDSFSTYKTNSQGVADSLYGPSEVVCNIQAKVYSLDTLFNSDPFISGIVVDDASVTDVAYAVRPKTVKSYIIRLIDELWVRYALTKNRDDVVSGLICEINVGNASRIDAFIPDVFTSGLRIIAAKLAWSFSAPAKAA